MSLGSSGDLPNQKNVYAASLVVPAPASQVSWRAAISIFLYDSSVSMTAVL